MPHLTHLDVDFGDWECSMATNNLVKHILETSVIYATLSFGQSLPVNTRGEINRTKLTAGHLRYHIQPTDI